MTRAGGEASADIYMKAVPHGCINRGTRRKSFYGYMEQFFRLSAIIKRKGIVIVPLLNVYEFLGRLKHEKAELTVSSWRNRPDGWNDARIRKASVKTAEIFCTPSISRKKHGKIYLRHGRYLYTYSIQRGRNTSSIGKAAEAGYAAKRDIIRWSLLVFFPL